MIYVKKIINGILLSLGYEMRRIPVVKYKQINIFENILMREFLSYKNRENFFVVQVGANDGNFADPLSQLIKTHRWNGILIEPQPDVFDKLKKEYKSEADLLQFENIAISSKPGTLPLYRLRRTDLNTSKNYQLSVSSVSATLTAKQLRVKKSDLEKIEVPSKTLTSVIEKYKVKRIALLQIDTEGHDFEVLRSLDFNRFRPKIIQFEHAHLSSKLCNQAIELLVENGYSIFWGGRQHDTVAVYGGKSLND